MQCKRCYYYFYFLAAVTTAQPCGWIWSCPPLIEEGLLSLKGNISLVKSNEGTFLHATCVAVMETKESTHMFWSIPNPAGGELTLNCKIKKYYIYKNENTCTLKLQYLQYYVGSPVTCHAGATLNKVLFNIPPMKKPVSGTTTVSAPKDDSWKPTMKTGLDYTIDYNTCENVLATCEINTADTDYTLQWFIFDGVNTTLLESNMKRTYKSSTVTLNQMISSKHDKSTLFCRCWRSTDGAPTTVSGEYTHKLKLVPKTCSNETDSLGASTKAEVGTSRDSHLLTIWLASGIIIITLMIVGTIAIFCCRRSRIRKSQDINMLKNIELNELYAQPVRKSKRHKRVESDFYALPSDENDSVYVYSEFEDDCHTYGNFPILISAGARVSDMSEPTYVNA